MATHRRTTALAGAFVVFAFACGSVSAPTAHADEILKIYSGVTSDEIVAFAGRQGWSVDTQGAPRFLRIIVKGARPVPLILTDCDASDRCDSGILRDISEISLSPRNANFWHWNQGTHQATAFGPQYVTLQRHVRFRGVTDEYLKDVIDAWVEAATDFWPMAKKRFDETAGKPGPKEGVKE